MVRESGYMMNRQTGLSQKEQLYMEDIMETIQLSSIKSQFYTSQCRTNELRRLCQHVAQHQQDDLQQLRNIHSQNGGQLQ